MVGIKTKEQFDILPINQSGLQAIGCHRNIAYSHGVRQRAEHVSEEEVTKLHRIKACKEKTPLNLVNLQQQSMHWMNLLKNRETTSDFCDIGRETERKE